MAQPPYDPYGGGYGSDPYGQPANVQHHYYGSAPPRNNGMATASMILGIVGIFCGVTSILAIIFGHIAHSQIKRTGEGGSGMATAGLVMGYIITVLWVLYWVVVVGIYGAAIWSLEQNDYSTY
jgi:tellurite resistance protein TehA-like permease